MIYLYILLALAVLGLAYMRFEASFVQVKRVKFTQNKKHLKVIQISDIHTNRLKVSAEKVRHILDNEKPDLVIMTGDYIEKPIHIPIFLKFFDTIKGSHNICMCLGNHDFEAFEHDKAGLESYIKEIESREVTLLENRSICFEKNSKKYNIIGIADSTHRHNNLDEAFKSACNDASANIAFSHNPDVVLEIPKDRVNYLFCGHFHGGQIWAPFDLEFTLLRHEKLCKMGIKRGLYKLNGINLYINRGLGNVCIPLRFLSRPEVTVFYLP